jgi:NAD-dependent deacetylase
MTDFSTRTTEGIRFAAEIIQNSTRGVVLSGAGISTPSGIPDFRSTGSGLWEKYDPFEVASLNAFRHHPDEFFTWLRPLAKTMISAEPNAAHYAIANLENRGYIHMVITQNIDGLHTKAGSQNVLEVHGTLNTLTCTSCYRQVSANQYKHSYLGRGEVPVCPDCNSVLKPDAILIGEQLPGRTFLNAKEASKACDMMLVVGSSLEMLPVAGLPMRAVENGAHLIIINQSPTYIDIRADVVIREDLALVIPEIAKEVMGE